MKIILAFVLLLSAAITVPAQNIIFKDGKTVAGNKLRRNGPSVMTTIPVGNSFGEISYGVAQIASIEFPEPPQLKEAATLAASGKLDQALSVIEPIVNLYSTFKDIKGNFWGEAAVVKLSLLTALGREKEAGPLIHDMLSDRNNSEVFGIASACQALVYAKSGKAKEAIESSNEIINQESAEESTLAIAYIASGTAHLELKEFEDAAMAYLHLPIFFPDQKMLMPTALLGTARAFAKLDVSKEVEKAIQSLSSSFPNSPEAAIAKTEFPNVLSRINQQQP